VLLPHTGPELAYQVAKRIQQQFVTAVTGLSAAHAACSMSVGLACMSISHPANSDQLVALADAALYRAKQTGSSCVFTHDPAPCLAAPSKPSAAVPDPMI
jgi:diguanylate cyclase (GGDEF)-like protein